MIDKVLKSNLLDKMAVMRWDIGIILEQLDDMRLEVEQAEVIPDPPPAPEQEPEGRLGTMDDMTW